MVLLAHAADRTDRKSTRLNSSHLGISYAVFCLKKKKLHTQPNLACTWLGSTPIRGWVVLLFRVSPRRSGLAGIPPAVARLARGSFFFFLNGPGPPALPPFPPPPPFPD